MKLRNLQSPQNACLVLPEDALIDPPRISPKTASTILHSTTSLRMAPCTSAEQVPLHESNGPRLKARHAGGVKQASPTPSPRNVNACTVYLGRLGRQSLCMAAHWHASQNSTGASANMDLTRICKHTRYTPQHC